MWRRQFIGSVTYDCFVDSSLLSACDWSPKVAETGIVVLDEVDKLARPATTHGRDVGGNRTPPTLI